MANEEILFFDSSIRWNDLVSIASLQLVFSAYPFSKPGLVQAYCADLIYKIVMDEAHKEGGEDVNIERN